MELSSEPPEKQRIWDFPVAGCRCFGIWGLSGLNQQLRGQEAIQCGITTKRGKFVTHYFVLYI